MIGNAPWIPVRIESGLVMINPQLIAKMEFHREGDEGEEHCSLFALAHTEVGFVHLGTVVSAPWVTELEVYAGINTQDPPEWARH